MRLSEKQQELFKKVQSFEIVCLDIGRPEHIGHYLVNGHKYKTALALERRGLVSVRYQGNNMGWVSLR